MGGSRLPLCLYYFPPLEEGDRVTVVRFWIFKRSVKLSLLLFPFMKKVNRPITIGSIKRIVSNVTGFGELKIGNVGDEDLFFFHVVSISD